MVNLAKKIINPHLLPKIQRGECYDSTCPFHLKDEPLCGGFPAHSDSAHCLQEPVYLWPDNKEDSIQAEPVEEAKSSSNEPSYYDVGGIKTRDIIEAKVSASGFTGVKAFDYGNLLKYVLRAPYKNQWRTDLLKAKDYITMLLDESPRS